VRLYPPRKLPPRPPRYSRRATPDDAEFLAWVTLAASRAHLGRGLWDVIIGADEARCLDYLKRLAIAEPRSLYHWSSYIARGFIRLTREPKID
jgi:hypothetical protein